MSDLTLAVDEVLEAYKRISAAVPQSFAPDLTRTAVMRAAWAQNHPRDIQDDPR